MAELWPQDPFAWIPPSWILQSRGSRQGAGLGSHGRPTGRLLIGGARGIPRAGVSSAPGLRCPGGRWTRSVCGRDHTKWGGAWGGSALTLLLQSWVRKDYPTLSPRGTGIPLLQEPTLNSVEVEFGSPNTCGLSTPVLRGNNKPLQC